VFNLTPRLDKRMGTLTASSSKSNKSDDSSSLKLLNKNHSAGPSKSSSPLSVEAAHHPLRLGSNEGADTGLRTFLGDSDGVTKGVVVKKEQDVDKPCDTPKSGLSMPPNVLTPLKRREDSPRHQDETDREVDAANGSKSPLEGGLKTTIGTGKFRASPILKNPKSESAEDEKASSESEEDQDSSPVHRSEAKHRSPEEIKRPEPRTRPRSPARGDEREKARYERDRERWEQERMMRDPYYESYARWPAPRPLDMEGDDVDGPNVISPNRPPYPPGHPGYTRYNESGERPSSARNPSRDRDAHGSGTTRSRERYYEEECYPLPPEYGYPPTPSRHFEYPPLPRDSYYGGRHNGYGPYSPSRNYSAEGSAASIYQYSPVRTAKSKDDREREPKREKASEPARPRSKGSATGTPERKEPSADSASSPWRPRHSEYPSHSPPGGPAWDAVASGISTPRDGPPPPPHYSPGPVALGYLASPREGWGQSPYPRSGPPLHPSRNLQSWIDSPEGNSATSPPRPMFREKDEKSSRPSSGGADKCVAGRPLPSTYLPHGNTWSFGGSFGGSFDERDIPGSPYGSGRLPPHTPTRGPPPPPPEDPYWSDYYAHPYDYPPALYSPRRGAPWAGSGSRLPPAPGDYYNRTSLPPPLSSTPLAKSVERSQEHGSSSKTKGTRKPSADGPTAVTPTTIQAIALQEFGEAVDYSKKRLEELLQLSTPAKSGSANIKDIPPVEILPSAEDTLLDDITNHDVLLGRGGGTNTQAGNKRFRAIVNAHQPMYLQARRKEKPLIARCIVEWIRLKGGRFLKKDDASGKWVEVGDNRAEAKTSQALREGLDVRATKNGVSSTGSVGSTCGGGSTGGSARKRKKEKSGGTPSSDHPHIRPTASEGGGYDHPGHWDVYPPLPPHSHYYGRPNFYDASRRIRSREDGYGPPPPHPYHHPGYGPPPPYPPLPVDYHHGGSPSKRIKFAPDGSRPVPTVMSSEEDRQYYKDFYPPPPPKSSTSKLPIVAPSYDQGDGQ